MRKHILFTLVLAMVTHLGVLAESVKIGKLYYQLDEETHTARVTSPGFLKSYTKLHTAIIPESVTYESATYYVTSIGNEAFDNCSDLRKVTIPNSVTSIGDGAFLNCPKLKKVTIPNSVTSIGRDAFSNIKHPVYNAHIFAFLPYSYEGDYTVPEGIETIAGGAFRGCEHLTALTIPNSVTSIGDDSFTLCFFMEPVYNAHVFAYMPRFYSGKYTIPEGIETIADRAFQECYEITSVTIPNSVTSIGKEAFRSCIKLSKLEIPDSVTSIGDGAFFACDSLTSITIPGSVTHIGKSAFVGCDNLMSVTIADGVTDIGEDAFWNCRRLKDITIPNSVTRIGEYAFMYCDSLTEPVYNAHVFAFLPRSYTGEYTVPEGIESIAGAAFRGCKQLTAVTIPGSVTNIGNEVFRDCPSLTSVTCNAIMPPECEGYHLFDGENKSALLYVPTESVAAYRKVYYWRVSRETNIQPIPSKANE